MNEGNGGNRSGDFFLEGLPFPVPPKVGVTDRESHSGGGVGVRLPPIPPLPPLLATSLRSEGVGVPHVKPGESVGFGFGGEIITNTPVEEEEEEEGGGVPEGLWVGDFVNDENNEISDGNREVEESSPNNVTVNKTIEGEETGSVFDAPKKFPNRKLSGVQRLPTAHTEMLWKPVQKGYPMFTDVLTERGWVPLQLLYNQTFLGNPVPFGGRKGAFPGGMINTPMWGQWEVGPKFPRLATMSPVDGKVWFIRPRMFIHYMSDNRIMFVKAKGVHLFSTLYADFWLHPRYSHGWKFVTISEAHRARHTTIHRYGMVNKFVLDNTNGEGWGGVGVPITMYGDFDPQPHMLDQYVPPSGGNTLTADPGMQQNGLNMGGVGESVGAHVRTNIVGDVGHPIPIIPKKHVHKVWAKNHFITHEGAPRTTIPTYNVNIPPYHNIIVRQQRTATNPRKNWIGGPVVVGDNYDKSQIRINEIFTKQHYGGSYSALRPDWREFSAQKRGTILK